MLGVEFRAVVDQVEKKLYGIVDVIAYAGANFTLSPVETLQFCRSKVYKLAGANFTE